MSKTVLLALALNIKYPALNHCEEVWLVPSLPPLHAVATGFFTTNTRCQLGQQITDAS